MHDWTLLSVAVDWPAGTLFVSLRNRRSESVTLRASGLRGFVLTRNEPWGPSVSVDRLLGPSPSADGAFVVELLLQSGDAIRIEAAAFEIPEA